MEETEPLLPPKIARRSFLQQTAGGLGLIALAALLNPLKGSASAITPQEVPPHPAAKAKRVIWLYMAGGPSQLESFDNKPELARRMANQCRSR